MDYVQVLVTNQTSNVVVEMIVVGKNALWKILQIIVLMGFTEVNGCLIVTKDIILQSNIGKD